jgi:hypothetical protein
MKPWYKSKIFLLASVMVFTALSQFYTQWIGGQITPEQFDVVANAYPELSNQIKTSVETNNYFAIISAVGSFLIAIWRGWFTTSSKLQF